MRLYHLPRSRSTRVLWLLEEIGAPYDLTVITREERSSDEHRQRHPLGRVPAIEEEGGFVFESLAICLHLVDQHPEAELIPPLGTHERALVYQWSVFAMTELEPAILAVFAARRAEDDERTQTATEEFRTAAAVTEQALTGHEYLVADRFTVADLVCGAVLLFARGAELTGELANIQAYVERLDQRPARKRATSIGT